MTINHVFTSPASIEIEKLRGGGRKEWEDVLCSHGQRDSTITIFL